MFDSLTSLDCLLKRLTPLTAAEPDIVYSLTYFFNFEYFIFIEGELVAMASSHKKNQLKLVHLPTCTVFENWPTEKTPLNKVTCLDFSPGGAFFAFGEDHGRVLLYRLNHYETA